MLTIMAGPDCNHDIGSVLDLPAAKAMALIAARAAVALDPVETAEAAPAIETAEALKRSKPRKP